jgi:hypothetical protein
VQRALVDGRLTVNGKVVVADYPLKGHDLITHRWNGILSIIVLR